MPTLPLLVGSMVLGIGVLILRMGWVSGAWIFPSPSVSSRWKRQSAKLKIVHLTLDDGPFDAAVLEDVLEALSSNKIPATFFAECRRLEKHRELVQEILRQGHMVGSHSNMHDNLESLTPVQLRIDLNLCEEHFRDVFGKRPFLIREPYGFISDKVTEYLESQNYVIVRSNKNARDWSCKTPQCVADGMEEVFPEGGSGNVTYGGILVMHLGWGGATSKALGQGLKLAIDRGFRFVPLPAFLDPATRKRLFKLYECEGELEDADSLYRGWCKHLLRWGWGGAALSGGRTIRVMTVSLGVPVFVVLMLCVIRSFMQCRLQ